MAPYERKAVNASTITYHPRVHLMPHRGASSFGSSRSDTERERLQKTTTDASDASSGDFDFEDIFIYDEPQKKVTNVDEVMGPARGREWSDFSFSRYASGTAARHEMTKQKGRQQIYEEQEHRGKSVTSRQVWENQCLSERRVTPDTKVHHSNALDHISN
jgi:hypothetical protein